MKQPIYLFILFTFFSFSNLITAQPNIPTLKQQLRIPNVDSCQLLYELGNAYERTNVDSCFYFLNASLDIAQRKNNAHATAQAMYSIGATYLNFLKNDEKAIKWLNKAIEIAKTINDNTILANAYGNLAVIDGYQNTNNADALLSKALSYAKATNDWAVITEAYDNISTRRLAQKDYKAAEIAVRNAMAACEHHSPDSWLSYGLDYTDFLESDNRKEEAFAVCQKLDAVRGQLKHSKGEFVYTMDIARLEVKLKHYTQADSLLQYALNIEKAKTSPDTFKLQIITQGILELHIAEGNALKVSESVNDLVNIRLSSKEKRLTEESKRQMAGTQSALDLEKKDSEIALLDEQKKRQQLFLTAAVAIALMLGGFMLILQRNKRRIEQQKAELEQQKAELTSLNATKDKLFAILSHDLMSPIATLKNYTMLVDWGAMSQAEFAESITDVKTDVNNLYEMLQNLLYWAISQMQGIKPKIETINVAEVINEQVVLFEAIAKGKGLNITQTIDSDMTIDVDRNHFALVIRNLLQNALKFTNKGGLIQFISENTVEERNPDSFGKGGKKLTFQDNGIGMTPDVLAKLFKTDQNANRTGTAKEGGTGLGLILTKELVELNGGTIDVASEVGKGTAFTLRFA